MIFLISKYFELCKTKSVFTWKFLPIIQGFTHSDVSLGAAVSKVRKVLELILLMGNIMNTGSRNEQSVGFDISYLPKLSNTKDRDNKSTLMHFLVETIEKSHPLVGFLCKLYRIF